MTKTYEGYRRDYLRAFEKERALVSKLPSRPAEQHLKAAMAASERTNAAIRKMQAAEHAANVAQKVGV